MGPGVWPKGKKRASAAPLGLERVGGRRARGRARPDWRRGTCSRAIERPVPGVDDVEHQRRVHADRRVQRRRRLPGAEAHARDELARRARRVQRHAPPAAGDDVARIDHAAHLHLHPLHRRIDVARGARRRPPPRPARATARSPGAAPGRSPAAAIEPSSGKRNSWWARNQSRCERIAGAAQIREHVVEVLRHEVRQREAIDEPRPPAHQPLRGTARATSRRSARARTSCCARLMRACGGISKARSSTSPWRPAGAVGAVELVDAQLGAVGVAGDVDQQVAEDAIDQPGRRRRPRVGDLRERELQLVDAVAGAPRRCAAPGWSAPRTARRTGTTATGG